MDPVQKRLEPSETTASMQSAANILSAIVQGPQASGTGAAATGGMDGACDGGLFAGLVDGVVAEAGTNEDATSSTADALLAALGAALQPAAIVADQSARAEDATAATPVTGEVRTVATPFMIATAAEAAPVPTLPGGEDVSAALASLTSDAAPEPVLAPAAPPAPKAETAPAPAPPPVAAATPPVAAAAPVTPQVAPTAPPAEVVAEAVAAPKPAAPAAAAPSAPKAKAANADALRPGAPEPSVAKVSFAEHLTETAVTAVEAADNDDAPLTTDTQPDIAVDTTLATAQAAPVQAASIEAPKVTVHTVAHLAAQIVSKVEGGKATRFDVTLNPEGLGKVDVRVEIGARGDVSAQMNFDNPEVASQMRARAGELQSALEQAGFDLSKTNLSFNSGGAGDQSSLFGQQANGDQSGRPSWTGRAFSDVANQADEAAAPTWTRRASGGVDVRI